MKPTLSIIVAVGNNRAIGKGNQLLWHISEDLKRFKQLTTGHPIIMGRKTYESIGRPLPNRINIIITRDTAFQAPGCDSVGSLDEALEKAKAQNTDEVFVIGGAQIYAQAIDRADRLYLTKVEGDFEADAFFPDYSMFKKVVQQESGHSGVYSYTFFVLEK
ncbi:dihydrofolate reductase [Candidatus Roizmanbacteria bacterium]|nr:dihydrofolate reductase [Candidatus Roizmanbacteria bacterium]